ncbi:hypothetical protein Sme01_24300 [Sphaerisporangium melleum]|uniref:Secreted protein n=1 Tax=Sphaerisporangium melleum TaxID=321316 RepID=A0A917QSP1_9ACTN|nr:hypothetical protein [Sphaerisporangium melleum]GGK65478.1 hypothetical protein GCM10007964_05630 [Sphaerisporangium melleum]GII69954.1 hypothetical protein Sme01_24300 [Sphaerisporangium melleum]
MKILTWTRLGLAAAVVCAAAATLTASSGESLSSPVPATCPQRWDSAEIGGWVPAVARVRGAARSLVPGSPVRALICAYPGDNTRPGGERLAGSRTLTDQAAPMARDLAYLPVVTGDVGRACTQMGGPLTNYLIRFAYPDGHALWVGTAEEVNHCVRTTNGTATSNAYPGPAIATAYKHGVWRPTAPDDPCQGSGARKGQDELMVPGRPGRLTVCRNATYNRPPYRKRHGRDIARALAATLNSLDTIPSSNGCHETSGTHERGIRLIFDYPEGPPAAVTILIGCTPAVDNGLLQADLPAPLRDRLLRLAPR